MGLCANLKECNVNLRVSASVANILLEDGSHIEWGARPLGELFRMKLKVKYLLVF